MPFAWYIIPMFIVWMSCDPPESRTFYVDGMNGSDSAAGRFTSSAWRHAPGDPHAAGHAARVRLEGGDTVRFKGGTQYHGTIGIRWSGKHGSPIVYDGNADGGWGTGRAIINGEGVRKHGFIGEQTQTAWITITHFEIRSLPHNPAAPWAGGMGVLLSNCRDVTVTECLCHDIGHWDNDGSFRPSGSGIVMKKATACTVSHCEVTKCGASGIWIDGGQGCLIAGNRIHHFVTWGIDLSGSSRRCSANTISGNTVHDLYHYDRGFWRGAGEPPHQDFVFIRKADGTRPIHNVVENNLFCNNATFGDFGGTAMLFLSFADSTLIRGNRFINPHSYHAVRLGWSSSHTTFTGNTLYCPRTGGIHLRSGGGTVITGNDIITGLPAISFEDSLDETGLICDSNTYWISPENGAERRAFARVSPYRAWSFSVWQERGYERHGRLVRTISDFGFVDDGGYPTRCTGMDLRRRSRGSAAPAPILFQVIERE